MANEQRVFYAGFSGTILDNPLSAGATTLTSAALVNFPTITSAQYVAITLDPLGVAGIPEIAYMTAHTNGVNTATIVRGQETVYGTSAGRSHAQGIRWSHALTAFDLRYPRSPAQRVYMRANYR